jgi:hypothetical protein
MSRFRVAALCAIAASAVACAKAIVDVGLDASAGDATVGDAAPDNGACPQYDLLTDPQHCGSCTKACDAGDLCSSGQCKAQCDPTLAKCFGDAGVLCVDIKSDPNHCGTCTTACATADAGSLQPGPNNPDAGIPFDGGYDGGPGWDLGTPACEAGTCAVTCPPGMTECGDGICYDPQNFHDHCGDCNTACATTEWCTQGHCCSVGTAYCSGACTDVLGDKNNCGSCGHVCPSQTPVCSDGQCTTAIVYSEAFTGGSIASTQCTAWNTFRSSLSGTYSSITISGSYDTTGRTCTGTGANTLCQALHNATTVSNLSCGSYTWNVDSTCGNGVEITADGLTCSCTPNPDYSVRPCIGTTANWGAINTAPCSPPSQTITVTCQ